MRNTTARERVRGGVKGSGFPVGNRAFFIAVKVGARCINRPQNGQILKQEILDGLRKDWDGMISFLEMVQRYPIGAKVTVEEGERRSEQEIRGYEYYNGTGYLLFGGDLKVDANRLCGKKSGENGSGI